jgi:hypothetical protein
VRLTTLTKEFFMPRFLERDEAEREPPCDLYPWDGVRNVRPFSRFRRASSKECINRTLICALNFVQIELWFVLGHQVSES